MASSKNIHLTFMSINFYVHNQQTLLKVNSLSIKIPIEMMKSNFNVRKCETPPSYVYVYGKSIRTFGKIVFKEFPQIICYFIYL